ncbi:hypothetical protein RCH05_003647 [Janthinobacterium sp. CAN_S7]
MKKLTPIFWSAAPQPKLFFQLHRLLNFHIRKSYLNERARELITFAR